MVLLHGVFSDGFFQCLLQIQVVRKALTMLGAQEMLLAVLYSEGFSYKEMAELTGIKYASVGKTLARTLQKLKVILNKMNYEMY